MGGRVAVTLRQPDGTEYRMCRWTNILPWYVTNMHLVNKDPDHIEEFLAQWRVMKDDWDRNGPKGPFDNNMTDFYVPYDGGCLAPISYGLVVIDMQKDHILSMQGYTSVGTIHGVKLVNSVNEVRDWGTDREDTDLARFEDFFIEGRVARRKTWSEDVGKIVDVHIPETFTQFMAELNPKDRRIRELGFHSFELDMSPFKVINFDETEEGCRALREKVLELGFKLSAGEEKTWDEFLLRFEEG